MMLLPLSDRMRSKIVSIGLVSIVITVVGALILSYLPAETESGRWDLPLPALTLGAIVGTTYGLLGAGLVIVFRTSRVINFAHGEIGGFAAAFFGLIVAQWHSPYWLAFPVALGLGAAVAAFTEVVVVRRLRNAPRLMSIIATLGVGQFLLLLGLVISGEAGTGGNLYPEPPGLPDFMLGGLRVSPAYSGMLILSPVVIVALGVFLKRTRFGIGIRSASDNVETARLVGIFASRMSSLAWGLAGALAAFTAILVQPTRGFNVVQSFGPNLLLMALAAAAIARMTSIPIAVIAGVGLGIVEQLVKWNYPTGGSIELVLFVIILVALLLQKQRAGREEEKGSWASVQAVRPLPEELHKLWPLRNLGRIVASSALVAAILLPFVISHSAATSMTIIFAFMIAAISIGVVTGLGGQLTLGQFAFAAIGAVVSYHVSMRTGWFPLAFLYGGIVAALSALLVGLPALRIRGLMITVTTLAFALVVPAVLGHPWLLGDGVYSGRPIVWGNALEKGREYYFVGLITLVIVLLLVHNVRNSGFGRLLVAIRDNEDAARAFTVSATTVKMHAFMFAGFIAGVGGAMYGHTLSFIGEATFPAAASIDVAKIAVIGGISMLAGPVIGALFVMGVPTFVSLGTAGLAATSLGQLLVIMYLPRGLVQVVVPLRDRIARFFGERASIDVEAAYARRDGHAAPPSPQSPQRKATVQLVARPIPASRNSNGHRPSVMLLEVQGIQKSFGAILAIDRVSFSVRRGETLGLIGPNGAGKTTTIEVVSGFTRADKGAVFYNGRDVTTLSPEDRARLGLIRSFQDAALFPTMTVEQVVMLACERITPTTLFSSIVGITSGDKRKRQHARAVINFMGLERYRTKQIMELSTGTRRIAELACLVALQPTLLLLDEPSSGVAQRETEALGTLLRDLKREFDMTLVIIEHDIPMIMSISDRIIAMADGRILATGSPSQVRNHSQVIEAYLGGSITAIERSGAAYATSSKSRMDGRSALTD